MSIPYLRVRVTATVHTEQGKFLQRNWLWERETIEAGAIETLMDAVGEQLCLLVDAANNGEETKP
jgi:hypothetical protein